VQAILRTPLNDFNLGITNVAEFYFSLRRTLEVGEWGVRYYSASQ
jgi:hypothetical protein